LTAKAASYLFSCIKKQNLNVMENQVQKLNAEKLMESAKDYNFCRHERETFNELVTAINDNDQQKLEWFAVFGDSLKAILLNVYAYRKGIEFGFTEIAFDQYGWFKRPAFLDVEELLFGLVDKSRYGTFSTITVAHGPNGKWTYGLSMSFGTAGSSSGISVYGEVFTSREVALNCAMGILKKEMLGKVGNSDTGNYNQKVILATLKDIDRLTVAKVQLSLF
jgi:hypothetical protein